MSRISQIRHALAGLVVAPGCKVDVFPGPSEYAKGRGFDTLRFVVRVMTGLEGDDAACDRLDAMLGTTGDESMKQRLEADPRLFGLAAKVAVTRSSGWRTYRLQDSPPMVGAEWTVEVLSEGA